MAEGLLADLRNPDGGFGARAGQPSEAEPTALAAIALDEPGARAWLERSQRLDGSFGVMVGPYLNDTATGLAAIALSGEPRERALDHLERVRGERIDSSPVLPIDPDALGWPWTLGTASWTEPTARAVLALRIGRPGSASIDDGIALLRDREAVGGGWNYGNRIVFGVDLPPFTQTTAIALAALRGTDASLESRGLDVLRWLWRIESSGGLSVATAIAALRLYGDDAEADAATAVLDRLLAETGLQGDGVALAWSVLATGDGLRALEAP